jgi:hypothetical protein
MDGRGAAQAHFVVFRPRARANRKRHACSPPNLHHSVRCVASSVRPSSSSRGKQRHHSLSQHLECSWFAENAAELGPKLPDRCLLRRLYGCHETPSVERRAPSFATDLETDSIHVDNVKRNCKVLFFVFCVILFETNAQPPTMRVSTRVS